MISEADTVPPRSNPPLVRATNVVKRYGAVSVLEGVSFEIGEGITGLLGANGAGKTTLLGLILGLHGIEDGTLSVLGIDPFHAGPEVRARLGYAPEHHTLPGDMKAADLVRHVAELHGLPKSEATTRASDTLWLVGLGEERFRPVGTLSTGQRQRVKLAQAIAHDPKLVLLDEPTDGLDPVQRDDMLDLIVRVARDFGIHFVISSHLLDEVEQICQGAVILGGGQVLAAGTLDELRGTGSDIVLDLDAETFVQSVAATMAASGAIVKISGRSLVVTGGDDTVFDVARDACAEQGAGIARLGRRRLTLEDIFLEEST